MRDAREDTSLECMIAWPSGTVTIRYLYLAAGSKTSSTWPHTVSIQLATTPGRVMACGGGNDSSDMRAGILRGCDGGRGSVTGEKVGAAGPWTRIYHGPAPPA